MPNLAHRLPAVCLEHYKRKGIIGLFTIPKKNRNEVDSITVVFPSR